MANGLQVPNTAGSILGPNRLPGGSRVRSPWQKRSAVQPDIQQKLQGTASGDLSEQGVNRYLAGGARGSFFMGDRRPQVPAYSSSIPDLTMGGLFPFAPGGYTPPTALNIPGYGVYGGGFRPSETGQDVGNVLGNIFGGRGLGDALGDAFGDLFGHSGRSYSPYAPYSDRFTGFPAAIGAYEFGQYPGITPALGAAAAQSMFSDPYQAGIFSEIERRSPLRTASWAEPMRNMLDPEVSQAISAMIGLTPTRLGITAKYGDLARMVQELVGAPELGAARQFIGSRLQEDIPEDMRRSLEQDIRTAQSARGLRFGQEPAFDEAMRMAKYREGQRMELLGPAMTLGFQTLGMTGFPQMAQIGPVNFAPVGTSALASSQQDFAQSMANTQLGLAGINTLLGAGTIGLMAGGVGGFGSGRSVL